MKVDAQYPARVIENYHRLTTDPAVLTEVREILIHGAQGSRTMEQRLDHAVKGIALQYAVKQYLIEAEYEVQDAPKGEYHYDLIVNGIKVDVKGRFTGKYFTQSHYERHTIEEKKDDVLYLCVDFYDDKLVHRGECWSKDVPESKFYPGTGWISTKADIL